MLLCNISRKGTMNPQPLAISDELAVRAPRAQAAVSLPQALGARLANIVLTAQVQLAYACAMDARSRALRTIDCITGSWPDTPVRRLVLDVYRSQARSADVVASDVLAGARRRCGLAFAKL